MECWGKEDHPLILKSVPQEVLNKAGATCPGRAKI